MADTKRQFTIIEGGTGPQAGAEDTLIHTGMFDVNGRPVFRRAGSGSPPGGGGEPNLADRVTSLEHHRQGIWAVIGVLCASFVGCLIYLLGQIDSRFDKVDEPLGKVEQVVASQQATLQSVSQDITYLRGRVDGTAAATPPPQRRRN